MRLYRVHSEGLTYPGVRVSQAWHESFKDGTRLASKHIWIAVRRDDKNAANALLHLMKMIMKGHSHNLHGSAWWAHENYPISAWAYVHGHITSSARDIVKSIYMQGVSAYLSI